MTTSNRTNGRSLDTAAQIGGLGSLKGDDLATIYSSPLLRELGVGSGNRNALLTRSCCYSCRKARFAKLLMVRRSKFLTGVAIIDSLAFDARDPPPLLTYLQKTITSNLGTKQQSLRYVIYPSTDSRATTTNSLPVLEYW